MLVDTKLKVIFTYYITQLQKDHGHKRLDYETLENNLVLLTKQAKNNRIEMRSNYNLQISWYIKVPCKLKWVTPLSYYYHSIYNYGEHDVQWSEQSIFDWSVFLPVSDA